MTGIQMIKSSLESRLNGLLDKSNLQAASRKIYPLYQKLQTERWETQNTSEGSSWPAYKSKKYAEYKIRKYSDRPGGGRKMLIATSTLAGAVIGHGSPFEGTDKHIAVFTKYSMQIKVSQSGTNAEGKPFDYPQYVAMTRPFMVFSKKSMQLMKDELRKFILGKS
jgi:hypothetical protein